MLYRCPACERRFGEPGFCPFDRTQLAVLNPAVDQPTVLSAAMSAVRPNPTGDDSLSNLVAAKPTEVLGEAPAEGPKTHVDQRLRTFPLTPHVPTPANAAPTAEITAVRKQTPAPPSEPRVRALSATDSSVEVLDSIRQQRASEYDRLVGQTLDGKYFVDKKIGEGGMGVVFAARHAVIERPLAIKVLKREVMRDQATIKRFVQEAKAASRIGHPNIVDVTDFGTTPDGMTYTVMEYVAGQTLGAAIRAAAPFPPLRAVRIAAQIARALGAAHDKGVVHRDLKPENVFLVDRDGRHDFVKIVDFGIAKVAPQPGAANEPRLTRAGSVFGTPEYMAPEQAAGRGDTDGRVDIYALGVILYEMICGRVPHRGDSMVRTLAMQMLDPAEPPSKVRPDLGIHPELEAVVMTSLAKKREQRYQTMSQFLDALERVLTVVGQSVTGSPVYALAPLPPGADPSLVATPPPGTSPPPSSRSKSPTNRRLKNEPEFVSTTDHKPSFEHVWTESDLPPPRARWPIFVLFALILGGAAGAIALVLKSRSDATAPPAHDAAMPVAIADAAAPPVDAMVIAEVDAAPPPDAGPVDAGDDSIIVVVQPDAGVRRPRVDAGTVAVIPDTPNGRGTIMLQVLTKPEGANLYVGTTYRGPGGVTLEEPLGTKLDVRCRLKGYKDGTVHLVFDGKTEAALCVLQRIKICTPELKNPFDDCEPAPGAP